MNIFFRTSSIFLVITQMLIGQTDISFYSNGMEYFNNGDYSKAITSFNNYTKQSEVDENLLSSAKLYIGESLLGLEQFDGAITQFESFIDEYPTSNLRELALYRLGNLYFEKKLYDKSRDRLVMLVNHYPKSEYSGSSYHLIGETFIEENDLNKAEKFFSTAVNSKQNNTFVDHSIFALANLYEKKGEYRKAVASYDKILGFHRESELAAQAQLRIGICYYQLKEYDNAILELSDPLTEKLNSDDRNDADYILANAFYNLKEFDSSSEAYKRILNNSPSEDMMNKIRYGLAWIHFQKGNYESSFKLFNLLSQSKDDSIALKSLYWSGESKRYEGKYDESIEIQKRFALKYPNHPLAESVRLNIGISKFSEDNFEASEESLLQAINSPDPIARSKSYTLLGEINLKKKDYSKAKSFFQNGINISQIPKELKDRCLLGLGVSNYYLNDNIEAIKNFNAINEGDTELDKSKLYFYRAEANFVLGNYSKSISDYNSIKAEDAQMTNNVSYGKGYSYFNLKDFGKSAYYFTEFIQNSSNDKKVNECQLRLADCFYAEKDFVKASTYYQRALINSDEFNNDERAFFNYAQSLFKSGSYTDAIKVLEQIQLKFPASSYADDSQYLIGWIAFQRNEFDEAIKNYNILIDRYPQSTLLPIAYYSIGDSYFNRGEYSKAVASYNRLIAQYPNSQYVFDAVNGIQYSFIVQDQQDNAINYLRDFISNHSGLDFLDKIQFKIGEIYYSANNYEAAILEYEKLIDNYPKSGLIPQAYYWLGKSLFILNRPEEAISFFEFVKNGYLNTEEGFNSVLELGNIFRKMNNSAAETVLYDEVIPKLSDSKRISEIKFVKAQSYIASEKIPEAYEALKEIVDLRDGSLFNHKAEIELGILELARGNFENSLSLFEDVAKNRKDDLAAQALYYIGLNYFQQERIPEAITELIKVRSVYSLYDEWYTKSLLLLGDCYVINGAKGDAADMYKAVLKRHRKNQYAEEAKEKLDKL